MVRRFSATAQTLKERQRLPLRLDAKLIGEQRAAALELLHRRFPHAHLAIKAHQGAMHALLQRVQRQQALGQTHCLFQIAGFMPQVYERLHGPAVSLAKMAALRLQPGLKLGFFEVEAGEQIVFVEAYRGVQTLGRVAGGKLHEAGDIDLDTVGRQPDRAAVHQQGRCPKRLEALAQVSQGLAQAMLCAFLFAIAP